MTQDTPRHFKSGGCKYKVRGLCLYLRWWSN